MRVFLISCVSKKRDSACAAHQLYVSPWFRKAWAFTQPQMPDRVYILSALYGLVEPNTVIEPYNVTIKHKSEAEKRLWAEDVLASLKSVADLENDTFIVLASEPYRRYIISSLRHHEIPMEGLRIGQQLHWLEQHT